jgi:hypothetical protein
MSIATVIGPTHPGTGVIILSSLRFIKSQSQVNLSQVLLNPTSIITLQGVIISLVTRSGIHTAEIIISDFNV